MNDASTVPDPSWSIAALELPDRSLAKIVMVSPSTPDEISIPSSLPVMMFSAILTVASSWMSIPSSSTKSVISFRSMVTTELSDGPRSSNSMPLLVLLPLASIRLPVMLAVRMSSIVMPLRVTPMSLASIETVS